MAASARFWRGYGLFSGLAVALHAGCAEPGEPPGARASEGPWRARIEAASSPGAAESTGTAAAGSATKLGSIDDSLPFEPDGTKVWSLAWRTWVYTDVGPKRTRYGYLRAGAAVDARPPAIINDGCAGGWYRINPRGFVCVGKGAGLDPQHPIVARSNVRPVRGAGLPYVYALTEEVRPPLYFRLPTLSQMKEVEGDGVVDRSANYRLRVENGPLRELLGPLSPPPDYLVRGEALQKPYGVKTGLHRSVHSGQANADSGFAIKLVFESSGRLFGLTTEHDLLPLDRTHVVVPSTFRGVELADGALLPVAFVMSRYAGRYRLDERGALHRDGSFEYRAGVRLSGQVRTGGFAETAEGDWVAGVALRRIEPRESFPSFATGDRKWLDISIKSQSLVAYRGTRPVYVTLVSTGRGGMGDPEKVDATVRGTFMIHHKAVSSTMDGDEDRADSYALQDVPFVQYFHKGYALHGTYWHDEFGKLRSHGCVNLSPVDAAWLFEWTDPPVPENWHAVLNKERGTVVYIHR